MSDVHGDFYSVDTTHISTFTGYTSYIGSFNSIDSTSFAPITGLVINDTTTLPNNKAYTQNAIIGKNDMSAVFADWTYANGHLNVDGTWEGGVFGWLRYDPVQLYNSIYRLDDNTSVSDATLVGYKYRESVRENVGVYYASMVVPDAPGNYENRWTFLKDNTAYAERIIQPFSVESNGIDAD